MENNIELIEIYKPFVAVLLVLNNHEYWLLLQSVDYDALVYTLLVQHRTIRLNWIAIAIADDIADRHWIHVQPIHSIQTNVALLCAAPEYAKENNELNNLMDDLDLG